MYMCISVLRSTPMEERGRKPGGRKGETPGLVQGPQLPLGEHWSENSPSELPWVG